jgi:predicted O-methyltransferase YrrM
MSEANPLRPLLRQSGVLDLLRTTVDEYNRLRQSDTYTPPTDLREFREVQRRSREPTDISDHLERLFIEALQIDPDTVVELGVRGGESTFVFERVARLTGADLVSVDIDETTYTSDYDGWQFVQSNDIEFANDFEQWCENNDVAPAIDVLFIDTSHRYEHTCEEIDEWFSHLSDDGVVLFHDTNMQQPYRREDKTIGLGARDDRGVIRAIEEYLDCSFDETESFVTVKSGFVLRQYPLCSGLAVLRKLDSGAAT